MAKTLTELFNNLTAVAPAAGSSGALTMSAGPSVTRDVGGVQFAPAAPAPSEQQYNFLMGEELLNGGIKAVSSPVMGISSLVQPSITAAPEMKLGSKNYTVANPFGNTSSIRIIG